MEYAISVFILGLIVSALVAKGLVAAQDFTKQELEQKGSAEAEREISG
jgi:hypothetical protein